MRIEGTAGELGLGRRWLVLLVAMLPLLTVWALAKPMFASPDEPAHMVRAQGAVTGDLRAPYTTDGVPLRAVDCLKFRSDTTADCMDLTWGAPGREQRSTAETYPRSPTSSPAFPRCSSAG